MHSVRWCVKGRVAIETLALTPKWQAAQPLSQGSYWYVAVAGLRSARYTMHRICGVASYAVLQVY